jgi:Sulfotransferase family
MDAVTPLFICGMGRSGTTDALRTANAHPQIALNGEIALPVLKQFLIALDAADRLYRGAHDGWLERKAEYMFESFGALSKSGPNRQNDRTGLLFRGHKTPQLEKLFDENEAHFASVGLAPRYLYCARNPFDCWRSLRAAEWNRNEDVNTFLAQYVQSFERLADIEARAGDRVGILNLDALIASGDSVAFYREMLFAPLGLDMPERVVRRMQTLSAKRAEGPRPAELAADDRRAIEAYPGIAEIHARMFAPFARDRRRA